MKIVTRFRYWLYYCIVLVFLIVTGCEENADKPDEKFINFLSDYFESNDCSAKVKFVKD